MSYRSYSDWTVDQFAKHYAETLKSAPNAWGQHISQLFGQSHNVMIAAREFYSEETVHRAFEKAVRENP